MAEEVQTEVEIFEYLIIGENIYLGANIENEDYGRTP